MRKNRVFGLFWLITTLAIGFSGLALADFPGGSRGLAQAPGSRTVTHHGGSIFSQDLRHRNSHEFAARSRGRPHITVHPRQTNPGPNAKRYCRFWLQKQFRISGPVIVPEMRCWWE